MSAGDDMALELKAHLTQLCETPGLSGYEGPVRDVIHEAWEPLTDEADVDAMGSLVTVKRATEVDGKPRRVMLTAHMDEIGLIVTKLDGAFLRVTAIGGVDRRVLPGQLVTVHGERDLPGVIGSRPPHVTPTSERNKYLPVDELVIDAGLSKRQLANAVSVGDVVSFAQSASALEGNLFTGKALDNRASVAALTACLHELQTRAHSWDVVAIATVQEEVGLRGGKTTAYHVQPDLAVVVDVTFGVGDGVQEGKGFALNGGPVLGIGPNVHTKLFQRLRQTAKDLEMDHNVEAMPRNSGTEAAVVQVSREGIPTALASIPLRNMHTPVEIVSLDDIERVGRLLAAFVAGLDSTALEALTFERAKV